MSGWSPQVVMTGGGALNGALVEALSKSLGHPVCILDKPQVMGALGAAVFAWKAPKNSIIEVAADGRMLRRQAIFH